MMLPTMNLPDHIGSDPGLLSRVPENRRRLLNLLSLIGLIAFWAHLSYVIVTNDGVQWDFRTYYHAARLHSEGRDFYDAGLLLKESGATVPMPYVYPYYTIHLFRPFLAVDLPTAKLIYFALKLAGILLLFHLWRDYLPRGFIFPALLFCCIAFRSALRADMVYGNISVFEQILLWGGVYYFVRGRSRPFYALAAFTGLFKLNTVALLAIAPFRKDRNEFLWALGCALLFAAVLGGTYALHPEMYEKFFHNLTMLSDRGEHNPSSLAVAGDLAARIRGWTGLGVAGLEWMIYGLFAALLCGWTYMKLKGKEIWTDRSAMIVVSFYLYALLMPRFKDYSYILLVVPAIVTLMSVIPTLRLMVVALIPLCVPVFPYQPLVVALVLHILYVLRLSDGISWGKPADSSNRGIVTGKERPASPASP